MPPFRFAHAAGDDWREIADACLAQLGAVPAAANLGFLYVTDSLADDLDEILGRLREATRVRDWVGAVGIGICATGIEYYDELAAALMLGEFPPDGFRVFPGLLDDDLDAFDARNGEWIAARRPPLALVHGDPTGGVSETLIKKLAERTAAGFLVGGLASSRGNLYTIANGLHQGGLSGVLFAEGVGLITRLSQGCSPIGPYRTVTRAQRNIVMTLDGRPALDVLKEDIGEVLSRDLMRIGRSIFVGLPIAGSDTGDYLVRNLVGLDPDEGLMAVGDLMEQGQRVVFCHRDTDTAREDLERTLLSLKNRLKALPRGGVYVTCIGRGANLFGPDSAELRQVRDTLGDFPLVGFFANGEISQDRFYGYTSVLTLFT